MSDESMNQNTPVEMPDSGITNLQMSATDLNEMFQALQWAGFSEKQALFIIGTAVAGGMMSPYISQSNNEEPEEDFDDEDDDFV